MGRIQVRTNKKGQNRVYATVRLGGRSRSAVFDRKTDAREWIQRTESEIRLGRHIPDKLMERKTLKELIDRYLREVLPNKKSSTQIVDRYRLNWWKKEYGRLQLRELTPEVIEEAKSKLAMAGRGNGPTSVKRSLANLSHALTKAVQWGYLRESPMSRVDKPKEPRGRVRYLSEVEKKRLLDACKDSSCTLLYPAVLLSLTTGIRRGELQNLRWTHVNFKEEVIYIEDAKNGDSRGVPLVERAKKTLVELHRTRRFDTNRVFPSANGQKGFDFRAAFQSALKLAGIPNFHWHDLRHTFASDMVMGEASLLSVAETLGHRNLSMTKQYSHLSSSYLKREVRKVLDSLYGEKELFDRGQVS